MSVVVGSISLKGRNPEAAFLNTITEGSPMVVVKNVRICNFSEYQYGSGGIVELTKRVSLTPGSPIWSNGAQLNLLRLLRQCIKIGISVSESFYYEARPYEAPFGECLARVLEQDGCGSGLMRSALGDYFVRRYPRALIEMHVFSRENNAILSSVGGLLGFHQTIPHVSSLLTHGTPLQESDNCKDASEESEQDGIESAPIERRGALACLSIGICALLCWQGSRLIDCGRGYVGWTVCVFGLGIFNAANILLYLSSYRWTWGWWW